MAHQHRLRSRLAAGWVVVLLVMLAITAFGSSRRPSLQEVSEGLTCQCGCGLTVANCNHPQCEFSVPVRQQIETMLNQGMGQREIIGFFRAKYGEKILSAPTREGFNLVAWIMPFAAVFAGCFIIVGAIYRWRANQVVEDRNWAIDQEPDPELRRQLQQEIEEQR